MKKLNFFVFIMVTMNAYSQSRYDVVIDEIMADPSPVVALPNYEWIEIKNVSPVALNLLNWRLGDASGLSGPFPNIILQPDSFLVICSNTALASISTFGRAISVSSFPSLDNDGELIFLQQANGMIMHAVDYSSSWYKNELKTEGGWSLEMIDPKNPCATGINWKASQDIKGGTPAHSNSISGIVPDNNPPKLLRGYTPDSSHIIILFDEPVDSFPATLLSNYSIDGGIQITKAQPILPLFNSIQLTCQSPMIKNRIYTLSVKNIPDCKNNVTGQVSIRAGLPDVAGNSDLVINEILFNPRSGAYDFVEGYNNTEKILDLSKIYVANRNQAGVISSITQITDQPWLIFPHEYFAVTENPANLSVQYLVKDVSNIFSADLPSYPDDEGTVIFLNEQGMVIDEVKYKDDWHFKLLVNVEGVSLERIEPSASSNDKNNWHSAAASAGYATPGYKNSQYRLTSPVNATIVIQPKIFSPDNDGHDDVAGIQYQLESPGYVANVRIYDINGLLVRWLINNKTIGLSGSWNWDGLDNNGNKLPVGPYVILTELFNLEGKRKQFKNVVVLAGRLG